MGLDALTVGAGAEMERTFTEDDVRAFARLTGDENPIHLDASYAATTVFKRPIAHGMLYGSLFSALLASRCPGPGTIYLGQTLRFLKPVFPGDTITAQVKVSAIKAKGVVELTTTARNQAGELVLDGTAVVKVPGGL